VITKSGQGMSWTSLGGGRVFGFENVVLMDNLLSDFLTGL